MKEFTCEKDEFEKEVRAVDEEHAARRFMEDLYSNHDYSELGMGVFIVKVEGETYSVFAGESVKFTAVKKED